MSLLEDVFLEDEAGEAQDLERVIEGDEFEERRRSDDDDEDNNSVRGDDEAEEDKRRVDPQAPKSARVVKNPRFVLNPARLTGPRGIQVIPEHFKDFKFKGKGHEKEDLDLVLKKLEHWTYRLYPKFKFQDCLKKIEALGKKRPVMVHLHKIRSDQLQTEETVIQQDSSDDETPAQGVPPEEDEFDKLLQQQIDISRTMTPAPAARNGFGTPSINGRTPFAMPKATSSPSISDEQKERMARNRRLAEERRLARLRQNSTNNPDTCNVDVDLTGVNDINNTVINRISANNLDTGNVQVDLTKTGGNLDISSCRARTLITNGKVNASVDIDLTENCDGGIRSAKDSSTHAQDTVDLIEVNVTKDHKETGIEEVRESATKNLTDTVDVTGNIDNDMDDNDVNVCSSNKSIRKTNIIDSSDEDCDMETVNTAVTVDVHNNADINDNASLETGDKINYSDSSDDDQDRVVNESVTVDIHNVHNDASDKCVTVDIHNDASDKCENQSEIRDKSDNQGGNKEISNGVQNDSCDRVDSDSVIVADNGAMEVDFGHDF